MAPRHTQGPVIAPAYTGRMSMAAIPSCWLYSGDVRVIPTSCASGTRWRSRSRSSSDGIVAPIRMLSSRTIVLLMTPARPRENQTGSPRLKLPWRIRLT